jgi:hypothetical protein
VHTNKTSNSNEFGCQDYSILDTGCGLLATGHWLLASGCWLLVAGNWLLAIWAPGYWLLAAATGCWLLAAGCWILDTGYRMPYIGCRARGLGVIENGFRRQAHGVRFNSRVQSKGFTV